MSSKPGNTKNTAINNGDILNKEILDIAEFLDCTIFWLMKTMPDALRNTGINWEVQDVKADLTNHLANPGCLTRGGHSIDGFSNNSIYTDYDKMYKKYIKGDYTDFERQAQQIINKDEEYHAYVSILYNCILC